MMRSVVSILASIALLLVAAGSVSAGAPTRLTVPSVEYDDPFVCAGDPVIHVSFNTPFKLVIWTDADGNVVRDAIFAPGTSVTLSDEATGRSLSGTSPAIFRTTYASDGAIENLTVTGLSAAIAIPGQGVVLLDTGYIAWSGGFQGSILADRGPHGWLGTDGAEAFCDYFRS
jgi:hypothetical protein